MNMGSGGNSFPPATSKTDVHVDTSQNTPTPSRHHGSSDNLVGSLRASNSKDALHLMQEHDAHHHVEDHHVEKTLPFQPVISLLTPANLYLKAVDYGEHKSHATIQKIFLLGILAGCHIGFGQLLANVVGLDMASIKASDPGLQRMLLGVFGLPFGLYMVVVTGSDLFTGNVAMVLMAVLEGKATLRNMYKSWVFSWIANFIGSLLLAAIAKESGIITNPTSFIAYATLKTEHTFLQTFLRGIMCNWLVCMAVYMSLGASDAAGKLATVFLPISMFVALLTDHCVANMFTLSCAMMLGADFGLHGMFVKNLIPATIGNIVGGAIPVGMMYWASYGSASLHDYKSLPHFHAPHVPPFLHPHGGQTSIDITNPRRVPVNGMHPV